jgi:preprotein translocase subunit YajC
MLASKVSALLLRLKMILNPIQHIMIAQAPAPAPAQSGGFEMFLPMILMIVIFYFLLIRPQTKREKERKKMVEALKSGDSVVTRGGIVGTVQSVKADTVTVRSLESKFELEKYSVERQITDKSELKENK